MDEPEHRQWQAEGDADSPAEELEPLLLLPKTEVNREGESSQPTPDDGEIEGEEHRPDMLSMQSEGELLAQLPTFVPPYPPRICQQLQRVEVVVEELSALGQVEDLLAHFRAKRDELEELLNRRKVHFAQFLACAQPTAITLDEKWRQTFPWTESINKIRSQCYKFRKFRPMQEEAINAALSGEDVFMIFATGAGKTLCYELPALYTKGITVVLSPLKSLMNDQCQHLASRFARMLAKQLHSDLSRAQHDEILRELSDGAETSDSWLKLCYVAPETFFQPYALKVFKNLHSKGRLARFVVDEVHVIREWAHFRPQYMSLQQLREQFPQVPITTTTATAPPPVITKVCKNLHLHDPVFIINNPPRKELSLSVIDRTHGEKQLVEWIKENWPNGCGIIYALTIRTVRLLCTVLKDAGIAAGRYHGGRRNNGYVYDQWMAGELQVVVATSAFGMGVDKPDVRYVIFYNLPQSMMQFCQGVGRAGRDGQRADGVVFWSYTDRSDILSVQRSTGKNRPSKAKCERALNSFIRYCQNKISCRMGSMMAYFNTNSISVGETPYRCTGPGMCDNCQGDYARNEEEYGPAQRTAREIASSILRIAKYVEEHAVKVGRKGPISNVNMLVDIFCGSRKKHILDADFIKAPDHAYGIHMAIKPTRLFVRDIALQMLQKGILSEESWHGRSIVVQGDYVDRLETTRFRTTSQIEEATEDTSPGSDKGKEKVTDVLDDDDDEAEPRSDEEERLEREMKRKKKTRKTTKKRAHSPSDLGRGAEPRLKRRMTSKPAVRSGRGATSSSSSSSSTAKTRKPPRPRSAKVIASKARVEEEREYPVEAVIDECTRREKVCVKWEGYGSDHNTWERKKGFLATAPTPYEEFRHRMQLEGRAITRDGPCECQLCSDPKQTTTKKGNDKRR